MSRELVQSQANKGYTFVWVVADEKLYGREIERLHRIAPVEITRRGSTSYHRHLYSSRYMAKNTSFPSDHVKRPKQTYLNTWTGAPLKKVGYDIGGRDQNARDIVRIILASGYLRSISRTKAQPMYLGARVSDLFRGSFLEVGLPADDFTLGSSARNELASMYSNMGLHRDHRKTVLNAPTWRSGDYAQAGSAIDVIRDAVSTLQDSRDPTCYQVLVKEHQGVQAALMDEPRLEGTLAPVGANPNRLLGNADIQVTDYSSIFYDFRLFTVEGVGAGFRLGGVAVRG
jgi:CDP-glycerol glycerophosphotransferase (TagB/SpsB family)